MTQRFEKKFIKSPVGCWVWSASKKWGYGQFWVEDRMHQAHRVAYELYKGTIPHGMDLDHLCRHRSCVNPAHLEVVTNRENVLRGTGPTAVNARKTHCSKGHALTEDNVYTVPKGGRNCQTCHRYYCREYARKRKLQWKTELQVGQPPLV